MPWWPMISDLVFVLLVSVPVSTFLIISTSRRPVLVIVAVFPFSTKAKVKQTKNKEIRNTITKNTMP